MTPKKTFIYQGFFIKLSKNANKYKESMGGTEIYKNK